MVTTTTKGHNPALVVTADHQIRIDEAPVADPGPGEVLVHIQATGICGSDVHFWRHGRIGDLTVDGDCILGHESAGVVVGLGHGVENLKLGDRVAIEPGMPCGHCFLCVGGRYNLCEEVAFSGVYPHHGTIQRYKVHRASHVHRLGDGITFQLGALIEPLSVAMHALRTTPIGVGTAVAIFGAGPIGLLTMAVARASGAHPIIITDIDKSRLEFAKEFEPYALTYQVRREDSPEESGKKIRDLFQDDKSRRERNKHTESEMPPLVLECTGIESSIATAAYTVARGGSINVVGVSAKPLINNIPFMHLSLAEIQLRFINRYHGTWPAALRAIEGELIDPVKLDSLVTHKFKLESAVEALEMVAGFRKAEQGERLVKVQIVDGPL